MRWNRIRSNYNNYICWDNFSNNSNNYSSKKKQMIGYKKVNTKIKKKVCYFSKKIKKMLKIIIKIKINTLKIKIEINLLI